MKMTAAGMRDRWTLPVVCTAAGAALPFLTRGAVELLWPRPNYKDTLRAIVSDYRGAVELAAWTAIPFVVLGGIAALHLRGEEVLVRRRRIGILAAFAVALVVGFRIHIPQTVPGVNLGIAFFPLYAFVLMPVAYAVGRAFARAVVP